MDESIQLMVSVHLFLYFFSYPRYVAERLGSILPPDIPFNCQHRESELGDRGIRPEVPFPLVQGCTQAKKLISSGGSNDWEIGKRVTNTQRYVDDFFCDIFKEI